jgi:hypothetical protein
VGGTEDEVRINLGRKKYLTKNMVDLILKS